LLIQDRSHPAKHRPWVVALSCFLLEANDPQAQQPYLEAEPNDTPQKATEFRAPATLMGDMPGGDQDAWLWTVSDVNAGRFWTLELQGLPGRLTIADIGHVRYDEAGNLAGFDRLLKIGSRDGAQPAVFDRLLFEPGEFLVGIARSGGSTRYRPAADSLAFGEQGGGGAEADTNTDAYRLIFRSDEPVPASSGSSATSQGAATVLESGAELVGFIESDAAVWYRFDIPGDKADSRWDFRVLVPVGRTVEATFRDAEGTKLASARNDSNGRLTLADISRPAGAWFVDVRPILSADEPPGFLQLISVTEAGQRIAGEEAEPNDSWNLANRADSTVCCQGEIGDSGDEDHFAYTLEQSDVLRALVVENPSGESLTACLLDERGRRIQCRDGSETIRLPNLLLPAGEYGVHVTGKSAGTGYAIAFEEEMPPEPGREVEPNDAVERAIGAPENNRIRGAFDSGDDLDYYRFTLSSDPQLWRVQAIGDGIDSLTYHDVTGTQKQSVSAARDQRRLRLDNLFLFPGTHLFSVAGRDAGDYTLLARALGAPNPDSELEPNDDASRRMPLRIGQTRIGLLSDPADVDLYRFHLAGWDHIRLAATPPADGQLAAKLYLNNELMLGAARDTEGPIELEGLFLPGDYQLELESRQPSDAEYTLSLERLDRFRCSADCEPNNNPVLASPMPPGRIVDGIVGDWDDDDWFELPAIETDQPVSFRIESESRVDVRLYNDRVERLELAEDRATSTHKGSLPAGEASYLQITGSGGRPYRLTMLLGEATEPPAATADLDASATLGLDADTVAAYARFGQQVGGELTVTNNGSEPLDLAIDASASDMSWRIDLDRTQVVVAPGAAESIDLRAIAPADARADKPVRIGIRAQAENAGFISVSADLAVDANAPLVSPVRSWAIPESLQGGLDVAQRRYGATLSAEPEPRGNIERQLEALIDGRSADGDGASFDTRRDAPLSLTVDLAGSDPVPVAGFGLNPLARINPIFAPARVELQLSVDGTSFETVATTSVLPVGTDQYVALDAPIPATRARLLLDNAWAGEIGRRLTLGEVKVIAEPGYAPVRVDDLNIAHPDNGGHVVWSNPAIGAHWDRGILTEDEDVADYEVPENSQPEWVLGFHHNRAAAIERLLWKDSEDDNDKLTEVTVSVSLESPVGPWRTVAVWNRTETGDEFVLETPIWARFVRFSAPATTEPRHVDPPEFLAVYERSTGEEYRSVASEWGFRSQSAWYEATQALHIAERYPDRGNHAADSADPLQAGTKEAGSVTLGKVSHWYRPVLPAGHNTMTFVVTGDPTVRAELSLTDTSGEPIVLRKLPYESTLQRHVFDAYVEEGRIPILEVREPPRNVLFLWDTSGSVEALRPMIMNSVTTYAADLVPGQDMANLQPFGRGGPILDEWYGEPYLMQMILNDYRSISDNSAAEDNQRTAAKALANRPGTKAIVLITDAETPREPRVWEAFARVRPRVFTLNVGELEQSQDLMQDWASVNDGHYAFIQQEGDMDIAFERVSAMLRKPAGYTLSMTTETREAPGPGFLRVVSGDDGPARGAVELILDASGSMLQRMDGRQRIDIAKEVLTTAIRQQIPERTPTALRVFGHRAPNACETNLEIPLQPLDTAAFTAKVDGIRAKNLARTPIADSLAAVQQDLQESSGPALIVLITDGEETCDGDPAAEIAELRKSGNELSLNIIGLAIDDRELADEFAVWAATGGGRYFAASDTESLESSVANALKSSYAVLDSESRKIAKGLVDGEPVALTQGNYRVVIDSPPFDVADVEIISAKTYELRLLD